MNIQRRLITDLSKWSAQADRKPLLIRGARQVGKSWAVAEWCRKESKKLVTINFEESPQFSKLFEKDLSIQRIVNEISLLFNVSFSDPRTVLFLDEIQKAPQAITALRYFYEHRPDIVVLAAGSLIEFILEEQGLPVGRIQSLYAHPLSFVEFLGALGKNTLADAVNSFDVETSPAFPDLVHHELLNDLKLYYKLGGMPKVVSTFLAHNDIRASAIEQTTLVRGYRDDFRRFAAKVDWALLETVFEKMGFLAGGPPIKFTTIDSQARSAQVRRALLALERAMLIHKIRPTSAVGLPLGANAVDKAFKLAFLDIGLLHNLLGFDWAHLSPDADLTDIADGRLAEQFVAQEIICARSTNDTYGLHTWHRSHPGSEAEVDFVVERGNHVVPVEVKSHEKGRLRSLHLFQKELRCPTGYVLSQRNVLRSDGIVFLPLYLSSRL